MTDEEFLEAGKFIIGDLIKKGKEKPYETIPYFLKSYGISYYIPKIEEYLKGEDDTDDPL